MGLFDMLMESDESMRGYVLDAYISRMTRLDRKPIRMTFEITPLCTLNCKMCYVHISSEEADLQGGVLSAEKILQIAYDAKSLGVHSIMLTGGECMLHPEFDYIYKTLYNADFSITIMTNGSLITDERVELFAQFPPDAVNITMYGFSKDTYEVACGNGNAFERIVASIYRLKEKGIRLRIQCTATNEMYSDVPKIVKFAKELAIPFILNTVLKANRNCTKELVDELSVRPNKFYNVDDRTEQIPNRDNYEACMNTVNEHNLPAKERQYGIECAAGRNMFFVNWKGEMSPCVTFDNFKISVLQKSLNDCWNELVAWADTVEQISECRDCVFYSKCHHCVALHYGDTHEFGKPSPRLCYKVQHGITD